MARMVACGTYAVACKRRRLDTGGGAGARAAHGAALIGRQLGAWTHASRPGQRGNDVRGCEDSPGEMRQQQRLATRGNDVCRRKSFLIDPSSVESFRGSFRAFPFHWNCMQILSLGSVFGLQKEE